MKKRFPIIVFLFFYFNIFAITQNKANNKKPQEKVQEKQNPKKIKYRDKLLEKSNLYPDEVYPNVDLNLGPEYVEKIKQPLDYSYKFFIKGGKPVFPMLTFMDESGMDTFSGNYSFGLGINFLNPVISKSSIALETSINSFSSGEGSGLSEISSGLLTGDTSILIFGFSISNQFYLMDYLFFSIGGGISYLTYSVEYQNDSIFIDGENKTLEDYSTSTIAPLLVFSLGADIPLYENIRGMFQTEYQLIYFDNKAGAYLVFNFGIHYLL